MLLTRYIANLPHLPLVVLAALILSPALRSAEDWPGFRGPGGMGVTSEKGLPLEWGGADGVNLLWKSALPPTLHAGDPDHNQSSPVVADGKVFVTTAHWPKGADKSAQQPEHHVACYEASSGKQLWDTAVAAGPWMPTDLRGGYAVPTPALSNGRIFALFGSSVLHALDFKGSKLWSYPLEAPDKFDVALTVSPIVYKDTVILLLDRKKPDATMIALDAATGALRWKQERPENDFSHMTPVLTTVAGKAQLLVSATKGLQGIDPENGEILWSCNWGQSIWPVSSPVMANGLVYAIGGRGGHGGAVVDPTGRGDVSDTHLKWKVRPMSEGLSSPVAFADRVYRLNSPAGLRCVRIADGEELFVEKLPGANPAVSPFITPEGHLYFASAGKTIVLEAGEKLKILAESDLGDPSNAAAAVANGTIFLKGAKFLHAIGTTKTQ